MKKQPNRQKKRSAEAIKNEIGNIDSYLGYWLRFVSNQVTTAFQQKLSEHNITVAEWLALRFLYSHASCSLTKLAEEMGMDKGAVSRLAERLENRELIKRNITEQDRRLFSIELTQEGTKIVPVLAKIADQNDTYFFGHLSKKEHDSIFGTLKDLANHHGFQSKPLD